MRVDKYTDVIEAIELAITHCNYENKTGFHSQNEVAKKKLKEALHILLRIRNEEWIMQKVKDIVGDKT